jgi:hypothetical protein
VSGSCCVLFISVILAFNKFKNKVIEQEAESGENAAEI